MEFFPKGSDLPPPYFWKLWNPWGTFDCWCHQKEEKLNFPKTAKMAVFKIFFFIEKVLKSVHNPIFYTNIP